MLQPAAEQVRVTPSGRYPMCGVKWYGEGLFAREAVQGADQSAPRLNVLKAGRLVYNRLFAWKASFALVTDGFDGMFVSNEFPQFDIDRSQALPEYLLAWCLSTPFLERVGKASEGSAAVSRNRLKEASFLDFDVLLPSLDVQREVCERLLQARAEAQEIERHASAAELQAREQFMLGLGFGVRLEVPSRRAFGLRWSEIGRWSADAARASAAGAAGTAGCFPMVAMDELLVRVQYGTSEKANLDGDGVPVLRMNNIKDGELDFGDLKHVRLSSDDVDRWRLADGDVLINRTNSKELVGKCAVFRDGREFVFASYLIRLQLDPQRVRPEYAAAVLNGPIGRRQIDGLSRQIIGQANINSKELRSLRLPLPPLAVQDRLIAAANSVATVVAERRASADRVRASARQEIEAALRGLPLLDSERAA